MAQMVPCPNPGRCGVGAHRLGSDAYENCISNVASGDAKNKAALSAAPPTNIGYREVDQKEFIADILSDYDDLVDEIAAVTNRRRNAVDNTFRSIASCHKSGTKISSSSEVGRQFSSIADDPLAQLVVAEWYDVSPDQADEVLRTIRNETLSDLKLTDKKTRSVTAKVQNMRELRDRIEALSEQLDAMKADLRDDEEIPLDVDIPLDDGTKMRLKTSRRFDASKAADVLTDDEKASIEVTRLDPTKARRVLPKERLNECLGEEHISVYLD